MSEFFKNTFGKDDSERTLQYDNTAFLFFLISITSAASLFLLVSIIKQIKKGETSRRQYQLVKDDPVFKESLKGIQLTHSSVAISGSFVFKVVILALLVMISILAYQKTQSLESSLKGFDPYQLLGVDSDTPVPLIKKAYRKLALQLHPDRNPNNPEAAAKFIFVSKAYECLTNQQAKQKCLKYGNPDGQESFNVGIALPSFLVERENHIYVMLGMFVILLLVIPKLFLNWNNRFQTKDGRGILVANYYLLYRMFVCNMQYAQIMKTLSQMKEVEDPRLLKVVPSDQDQRSQKEEEIPAGKATTHDQHKGGCCGGEAQSENSEPDEEHQEEQNNKDVRKDAENTFQKFRESLKPVPMTQSSLSNLAILQKYIQREVKHHNFLQEIPNLLRSMVYFSLDFCTRSNKKKKTLFKDNSNLFIPYEGIFPLEQIIRISRDFYQNRQASQNGIENLSITPDQLEALKSEFNIRQLISQPNLKQRFLAKIQSKERREAISKQIDFLPHLKIEVNTLAGVVSETTFTDRDIVTFEYKVTKNPTHGVALLPKFGYLKREKFYLSMQVADQLMYFQEIVFEAGQTEHVTRLDYVQKQPTGVTFVTKLRTDCYYGLDVYTENKVKFVEYSGPQEVVFNKEDLYVERMPKSYFEQMMTLDIGDPQDEELSDTAAEDTQRQEDLGPHPDVPLMQKAEQ